MDILTVSIIIIVAWGLYGIVAGMFASTESLRLVAAAMILFYVYNCFLAIRYEKWMFFLGVPAICVGFTYGVELLEKQKSSKQ